MGFDCVRRSGVKEAKLLCKILPKILVDFFSAADVMNRVINEFISPGQPHQVLLAGVLFAVFQQAALQDQIIMMQQWVLSLYPILQNDLLYPIPCGVCLYFSYQRLRIIPIYKLSFRIYSKDLDLTHTKTKVCFV